MLKLSFFLKVIYFTVFLFFIINKIALTSFGRFLINVDITAFYYTFIIIKLSSGPNGTFKIKLFFLLHWSFSFITIDITAFCYTFTIIKVSAGPIWTFSINCLISLYFSLFSVSFSISYLLLLVLFNHILKKRLEFISKFKASFLF